MGTAKKKKQSDSLVLIIFLNMASPGILLRVL